MLNRRQALPGSDRATSHPWALELALAAAVTLEAVLPLRVFHLRMEPADVALLVGVVLSGFLIVRCAHALAAARLRRWNRWAAPGLGVVLVGILAAGGAWHGPPHYTLVSATLLAVGLVAGLGVLAGPGRARWRRVTGAAISLGVFAFLLLLVDLNLLSLFPRHVSLLGTLLAGAWLLATLEIAPVLPVHLARQGLVLGGLAATLCLVLTPSASSRVAGYLRRQSDLGSLLAPVAWAHSARASTYLVWGDDACPVIPQQPVSVTGKANGRNVLLITIDTLRRDLYLGPGQTLASAYPNLAAVAGEGCQYQNARSMGASTHLAMPAMYNATLAWTTLERPLLSAIAVQSDAFARVYGGLWQIAKYTGMPEGAGDPQKDSVTDRMIKELGRAAAAGKPFLFVAHYLDLHLPRKIELLSQFSGDLRPVYAGKLRKLDAELGRLFAAIKARGQWDNTIVVITADHGEELNERGYSEHAFHLYDTVLGVPLITRIPGSTCLAAETAIWLLDVVPMIASGMGLGVHSPALTGDWPPRVGVPRYAYSTVGGPFMSIVDDNLKIIVDARYGDTEVYDLEVDPGEAHDIGGELTPAIAARLRQIPLPWNPLVPLAQRYRHAHGTEFDVCPRKIVPEPPRQATVHTSPIKQDPQTLRFQ